MEQKTKPQLSLNNDIPCELLQAILLDVAQYDLPSRFVTPFVCHQWNNILKVLPQPKPVEMLLGPQRPSGCKAMAIAARKGHHSLVKWFHEQGCPWDQGCCAAAARGGHLDILMWLKDQGCPFKATPAWFGFMTLTKWRGEYLLNNPSPDSDLFALKEIQSEEQLLEWMNIDPKRCMGRAGAKAAKGGHTEVLQWAVDHDFPVAKSTIAAAAGAGHLDIVKWLVERYPNCAWDDGAAKATLGGHLDVLQWFVEHHPNLSDFFWSEYIPENAAKGGHLHALKWLREKGSSLGDDTSGAACGNGWLEILKWLREQQLLVISDYDVRLLARNGHCAILKWLREIGTQFGHSIMDDAARSGDLETLKWLREVGSLWGPSTFGHAASNGGWDVLMWLKEQGCPWEDGAIWGAAQKGRIDVVKWLRDQGCPWDDRACRYAAGEGHFEVVKWLKEQGCPGYQTILSEACRGGFLDIAIWAKENGCYESLDDIKFCRLAAEGGHLNILKWLREQGFPWDCLVTFRAVGMGHSDVFFWAIENGCPLGRPLARTNEQI